MPCDAGLKVENGSSRGMILSDGMLKGNETMCEVNTKRRKKARKGLGDVFNRDPHAAASGKRFAG
jgi:hypothetical protein